MIDLHTHILPKIDDGAKNLEMSLAMLHEEQKQEISTVVLTPHFYRNKERAEAFLIRRQRAFHWLQQAVREQNSSIPRLILGAEVAWVPNLAQWPDLHKLCIGNSRYLLLELPFYPWNEEMIRQLYDIMGREIIPVFAHFERYLKRQKKAHIQEILGMGTPVQVSCEPLMHFMERRQALKLIRLMPNCVLGSDCHNLTTRQPNLKAGMDVVQRLLGEETARILEQNAELII